jgi:uncharacterized OB-fold protein
MRTLRVNETLVGIKPIPLPDADTEPFWSAAKEHRLVVQFCSACDKWTFPPKPTCPACGAALEWRAASGLGHVYSYCISRMNFVEGFAAPYVVAWVSLDEQEDCRLNANILDCGPDDVYIGMPVEVVFDDRSEDVTVAQFRPRR